MKHTITITLDDAELAHLGNRLRDIVVTMRQVLHAAEPSLFAGQALPLDELIWLNVWPSSPGAGTWRASLSTRKAGGGRGGYSIQVTLGQLLAVACARDGLAEEVPDVGTSIP